MPGTLVDHATCAGVLGRRRAHAGAAGSGVGCVASSPTSVNSKHLQADNQPVEGQLECDRRVLIAIIVVAVVVAWRFVRAVAVVRKQVAPEIEPAHSRVHVAHREGNAICRDGGQHKGVAAGSSSRVKGPVRLAARGLGRNGPQHLVEVRRVGRERREYKADKVGVAATGHSEKSGCRVDGYVRRNGGRDVCQSNNEGPRL